jgi:hypothetical protein
MHVNRGLLGWGVFFITLGCVPLAVRAGYLDPTAVARAWELWPLILVGIGLSLILRRTRAAAVGGLMVAVTFGLMAGSLMATGLPSVGGISACGFGTGGGNGSRFPDQAGTLALEAQVDLELNCGELTATGGDGTTWAVTGTADGGRAPEIQASGERLRVRSPSRDGSNTGVGGSRWVVTLPRQVSMALGMSVNAGSARMDLAAMRVPKLGISVNAGDATIDASGLIETASLTASVNAGSLAISLPVPASTLHGSLSVNAGTIDVCVPDGVSLVIRTGQEALGSDNFADRGLVRTGNTWTRPGFATATQRIELDTDANLGSITLNPEAGCG